MRGVKSACRGWGLSVMLYAVCLPHRVVFSFIPPTSWRGQDAVTGRGGGSPSARMLSPLPPLSSSPSPSATGDKSLSTLQPSQNILTVLESQGRFRKLIGFMRDSGMAEVLQSEGPFTLLAPTDDAWKALDKYAMRVITGDVTRLRQVMMHHIIPSRVGLDAMLKAIDQSAYIKSMERSGIKFSYFNGGVMIGDAKIKELSVTASNGLIHVVDQPILPYIDDLVIFNPERDEELDEQEDTGSLNNLAKAEPSRAGVTPPLGMFDPLGLFKGKPSAEPRRLREAEVKHGRLAMLAVVGMLLQSVYHPLWGLADSDLGPSINHVVRTFEASPWSLLPPLILAIKFEVWGLVRMDPKASEKGLDYLTGDLGLDILRLGPDTAEAWIEMRSKELNNGRLAMIAAVGIVAQELVTGRPIW